MNLDMEALKAAQAQMNQQVAQLRVLIARLRAIGESK